MDGTRQPKRPRPNVLTLDPPNFKRLEPHTLNTCGLTLLRSTIVLVIALVIVLVMVIIIVSLAPAV